MLDSENTRVDQNDENREYNEKLAKKLEHCDPYELEKTITKNM